MTTKRPNEIYTDEETTRRMDDALRRALNTPHKPHAPLGKKRKAKPATRKSQAKRG